MSLSDILILAALACVLFLAARSMIKRKTGCGCGCGCEGCAGCAGKNENRTGKPQDGK